MKNLLLMSAIALSIGACKQSSTEIPVPGEGEPDEPGGLAKITEVGAAIGPGVSKSIGPAGGTLVSEDGAMVLTFPAGALEKEAVVKLQRIENYLPNGLDVAYRILPAELPIKKKLSLCWKFNKVSLHGAKPSQLLIARQGANKSWSGSKDVHIDQQDSTLCFQGISDLKQTDWAVAGTICMKPPYMADFVMLHGQVDHTISSIAISNNAWNPIPAEKVYRDKAIKARTVNGISSGNELEGYFLRETFSSSPFSAQYNAPVYKVPTVNPVEIKAIVETQPGELIELVAYQTVMRGNNSLSTSLEGSAKIPNGFGSLKGSTLSLFINDTRYDSEAELVGVITVKDFDWSQIKDFQAGAGCQFTFEKHPPQNRPSRRYDSAYIDDKGDKRYGPGTLKLSSAALVAGKPNQRLLKGSYQAEVRWQSGEGYHTSTMSGNFEGLVFLNL